MKHLVAAVAAAALLLHGSAFGAEGKKPVHNLEILFVAPSSFGELSNEAELIVHVRITDSRPEIARNNRCHRAKVLDVLRSQLSVECAAQAPNPSRCAPAAGEELLFLQKAGEIETGDAVIRIAGTEPLASGKEYILFLRWDPYQKAFLPFFGPNGAFEVAGEAIEPTGIGDIAREQRGKKVDAFKEEVRAARRKR